MTDVKKYYTHRARAHMDCVTAEIQDIDSHINLFLTK